MTLTPDERATKQLRLVKWCNLWNRIRANDSDGAGSKMHLTEAEGVTGETLCGKSFPADKGHSSGIGTCKRCLKKAYACGYEKGFLENLSWVPSVEGY